MVRLSLVIACSLVHSVFASPAWMAPSDLEGGALRAASPWESVGVEGVADEKWSLSENWSLGVEVEPVAVEAGEPKWFVRVDYLTATKNTIGDIVRGDIDLLGGNESWGLTVGRYVKRDLFGWPIDLSVNGSVHLHPANVNQDRIFEWVLWFQLQWTKFPWNDHLRTRLGVGEGLSYLGDITYSEMRRRGFENSERLLNYLDFSLSFNMADLLELTRLGGLLPLGKGDCLEDAWLEFSIHHRSGAWGLFGDFTDSEGDRKPVKGGDNRIAVGVRMEF